MPTLSRRPFAARVNTKAGQNIRSAGFTLIELMIVVVVIAILASIAYPSYQEQIRKARRADAQSALMQLAQHMERHYTATGSYLGATLPFTEAPIDGNRKHYDLGFVGTPTATTYTLQASPKNAMAGDSCGRLYLAHTGRRSQGVSPTNAPDPNCWVN